MPNAEVVVLAEDRAQQNFALRYLERLGFNMSRIRKRPLVEGAGAGEQHVRETYSKEVEEHRERSTSRKCFLVVLLDADKGDIARRAKQLADELQAAGLQARTTDETIVHLIPRRNIKTWILYLNGHDVNEDTAYHADNSQIKPAAQKFYELTRANAAIPDNCLPSLLAAIPEAQRLG